MSLVLDSSVALARIYPAYLELAQRRSLPLASLDSALRSAARSLGVELAA